MSKYDVRASVNIKSCGEILKKRGLEDGGKVQQIIDSEVLRRSDPLVPKDTGMLIDSGILSTDIGSGEVNYETPYAAKQYYTTGYRHAPGRICKWFEAVKVQKHDILETAAKAAGGKATT